MLSLVARPAKSFTSSMLQGVNGGRIPIWSGRYLCQEAAHPLENIDKTFVAGPLTMLSEEEQMMRDTGRMFADTRYICRTSQSSSQIKVKN